MDEQTLPPCLQVTARTRGGMPMALRHATLPIEGVQFHPESVLTSHGQTIITSFVQAIRGNPSGAPGPDSRTTEVTAATRPGGAQQRRPRPRP